MTSYSVQLPFMPVRPEQAVPFASFVQRAGARRLWAGQAAHIEQHQIFAYLAGLGIRVSAGFGVNVMPLSHPVQAAIQARSVAAATGSPVVASFGPGTPQLQESMHGAAYPSQIDASREYLVLLRDLLSGAQVVTNGSYFSYRGGLPSAPPGAPKVEVGLGVLRPGMARLAGEVADVAVTLLTPATYLRDEIVPEMRAASRRAARPMPRLVAIVPVALARAGRDPLALADSIHLRLPHYRAMLALAGIQGGGQQPEFVRGVIDGGASLVGEPDVIAGQLKAFEDADVDETVISVTGVCVRHGPQAALEELEEIFAKAVAQVAS